MNAYLDRVDRSVRLSDRAHRVAHAMIALGEIANDWRRPDLLRVARSAGLSLTEAYHGVALLFERRLLERLEPGAGVYRLPMKWRAAE